MSTPVIEGLRVLKLEGPRFAIKEGQVVKIEGDYFFGVGPFSFVTHSDSSRWPVVPGALPTEVIESLPVWRDRQAKLQKLFEQTEAAIDELTRSEKEHLESLNFDETLVEALLKQEGDYSLNWIVPGVSAEVTVDQNRHYVTTPEEFYALFDQ